MQPCLTPFQIGDHAVVPWSTCAWLLSLCEGLILTLSNAGVFQHMLCCSTYLNAAHYQNPLYNI